MALRMKAIGPRVWCRARVLPSPATAGEGPGVRAAGQVLMDFWRANSQDMQVGHLRQRYLWGLAVDQILAEEDVDGGTPELVKWILTDHLNTVRDIARYDSETQSTTVVNHLVYDAYGNVTAETNAAVESLFLFTARPFDPDTGLQNNLNRWYDPSVGRWLSEDPAQADINLCRYVANNPVIYVDPTGLWKGDTHRQLTRQSFLTAFPDYAEVLGDACAAYILEVMTQSNLGQDAGSMPWSEATQPGQQNYRHYCRDQQQSVAQANTAYAQYLNTELNTFNTALAGSSCHAGLQALGRLTHSWQDYYGHAVTLAGRDNAWGTGIATGNPDAPGSGVKAPTFYYRFGYPAGEHGLSEPGDRDPNSALRRSEAIDFVAGKIKPMLDRWLEKCRCNCPPQGSNYVTV